MVFVPPSMNVQLANAKLVFDFFAAPDKFGPIGATALDAMADQESKFLPTAVGDYAGGEPKAWGLFQLHPGRCNIIAIGQLDQINGKQIYPGCGIDVRELVLSGDGDVLKQCEAAWWELCHSEHHAKLAISMTKTPYEAGAAASQFWMRPKADERDSRGKLAEKWAKYFGVTAL